MHRKRRAREAVKPITIRIPDVMHMTGLCRSTVYELIAAGEIDAAKVGRATVVFVDSVERLLDANRKLAPGIGFRLKKEGSEEGELGNWD